MSGVISDGKVNILDELYRLKVKKFQQFTIKLRETKKKVTEKQEFLGKTNFRPTRFFYMIGAHKPITVNN